MMAAFFAEAQNSGKAYAITGDGNKDYMWMNIRQVDLASGKITGNIFERNKTNFTLTDIASKKTTDQAAVTDGNVYGSPLYPTSSFVAAAAYDKRNDKLFFTPMRRGELRWMDLGSNKQSAAFYSVAIPGYVASDAANEDQNITRMAIGSDNKGYAVTNDGSHLYEFTTGKKPVIKDLGSLIDATENNGLSVHNKCSSWGGDMIADAYGKLYIISASKAVFVIDPSTKIAAYKGHITGLPAAYTTNGAAVDENGDVVLCSAVIFDGYYRMNINDLKAVKIEGSDVLYNASDLASGNLLFQKEADEANKYSLTKTLPLVTGINADSRIFPNPVTSSSFKVLLDGKADGQYNIIVTDLAGRAIQSTRNSLAKGQQAQEVSFKSKPAKGTYIIKVTDDKNNIILAEKIMVL